MAATSQQPTIVPGFTGKAYPDVFNVNAMRIQPQELKQGQLPESMIRQFFEDGYVIVKDFFTRAELDTCRNAVNQQVENLAQKLYGAGKIKNLYSEYGFFDRLTKLEEEFPGTNIILHKGDGLPEAFRNLWTNERLLNVVEQLIGPDIAGHPVWNLRTKTPQNEATTVPWHQDSAYLDTESYHVLQPTAWIPLLDAHEQNGCMQVIHKGHKKGIVGNHQCCHGGTWYVMLDEEEMQRTLDADIPSDIRTCPVPYGGMLLLNNVIPHRSLPNMTNQIRWSLDLRFQNPTLPYGFYGMKKGVIFRKSNDPDYQIPWQDFLNVDRRAKQRQAVKDLMENATDEEFSTTLEGPWMRKWEIVHTNQHTKRAEMEDSLWDECKA
ncbi:uncharacterized protein LOC110440617 [Mizuhopecten yessoensis]|uniref:Phytanoyl-CoA dioxygenase domain-containing protein 1-like n=1 Tax=Mizuhopecten yessoensis TaxID=6573 RepID=A0A210PKR2_MIZYE|nr:uncharacterized protein LOC110440617 [Mizuhopecten yessoensis]OWF37078.1 hypothetical protein KP79_PYT09768 [Mizuhopecten yessoensis]